MEQIIKLHSTQEAQGLFGKQDENILLLEKEFRVKINLGAGQLRISGRKNLGAVCGLLEHLLKDIRAGRPIAKSELHQLVQTFKGAGRPEEPERPQEVKEVLETGFSFKGRTIGPKTDGQQAYVEAIKHHDIVFGIGPAGTGKTYLAMAMAVEALRKGYVRRIILTRPAIEAGESLGFLPGTLYEKVLPYLRPLYDALYDMMDTPQIEKYIETGIIEVAPLAYMRGRTLNDAFVILDEAQNCTPDQIKMFLTRLGFDSKTVITGDITQSDLPEGRPSGLIQAISVLKNVEGISFVHLTGKDVVRHEIVQRIIAAYALQVSQVYAPNR